MQVFLNQSIHQIVCNIYIYTAVYYEVLWGCLHMLSTLQCPHRTGSQSRADDRLRTFVTCVKSINILQELFRVILQFSSFAHCISRSSKSIHTHYTVSTQIISLYDAYTHHLQWIRGRHALMAFLQGISDALCMSLLLGKVALCIFNMFDACSILRTFKRLCSICSCPWCRRVDEFGVCRGLRGCSCLVRSRQVEWSSHRRIWCHVQNVYSYISMYIS